MTTAQPEPVAVKTDDYGRPVAFVCLNADDTSDEVVVVDCWARYWDEQDINAEMWTVMGVHGDVYILHHQGDRVGRGCVGHWTAIRR